MDKKYLGLRRELKNLEHGDVVGAVGTVSEHQEKQNGDMRWLEERTILSIQLLK